MTFMTAKTFPITITKHLSAIHCNTVVFRQILTDLSDMRYGLKHKFTLIDLTEIKLSANRDQLTNISMPGYIFLSQPSHYYIKEDLNYIIRGPLKGNFAPQEFTLNKSPSTQVYG